VGRGQPAFGLLGQDGAVTRALALLLAAALLLGGCTGDDSDGPSAAPTQTPTPTASASPTPPPKPGDRDCYRLDHAAALAPTAEVDPVPCDGRHTAMTYAVGGLGAGVDPARTCTERFADFVGGTPEDRHLTMLRPVWFTPTEDDLAAGASWYRCDAVALAGADRLAPLTGRLKGALDRDRQRDTYAMCGTARPGTPGFERVACSRRHTWRAVATVPFDTKRYPGLATVRSAGEEPCQEAGAAAAGGSLDYEWGYEWPTAEQWRAGQRYGLCWAPAS
jgi:putative regulator of septum formation